MKATGVPFKATRLRVEKHMKLPAPPETVFPLLCPIREYEWIESWACDLLYSASGVAEQDCVFRTNFPVRGGQEIWTVCRYEPPHHIEFVRTSELCVTRLALSLARSGDNGTSLLWKTVLTGLSEEGNTFAAHYAEKLDEETATLERFLTHFLRTGEMMRDVRYR